LFGATEGEAYLFVFVFVIVVVVGEFQLELRILDSREPGLGSASESRLSQSDYFI
jgi:hypothetical protein